MPRIEFLERDETTKARWREIAKRARWALGYINGGARWESDRYKRANMEFCARTLIQLTLEEFIAILEGVPYD